MKQNSMRARLKAGENVYGTMIQDVRTTSIGMIMADAGCDFLFFDMEHGPFDIGVVADMVKASRQANIVPLVRVPSDSYDLLMRPLDAGAQGIMIPRIETRSQVERIMEMTMYPPQGSRGCSTDKGHNDYKPQEMWSFTEQANQENLIILQIERAQAIEKIDEILSIKGVGAAVLGPYDLALSMGVRDKDFLTALESPIQHVLDTAKKKKIPCGIHISNIEWLIEWQRRGMQILAYSNDIVTLRQGVKNGLDKIRDSHKK